eukprot:4839937-Prymnesium_polylepis.1
MEAAWRTGMRAVRMTRASAGRPHRGRLTSEAAGVTRPPADRPRSEQWRGGGESDAFGQRWLATLLGNVWARGPKVLHTTVP